SICLLQYLAYVHRMNRIRRAMAQAESQYGAVRCELSGVTGELDDVRKDLAVERFEAEVLREFVAQLDGDKALRTFLKRLVPAPGTGFAAFLRNAAGRMVVSQSYGLQAGPTVKFELGDELLARLGEAGTITLDRQAVRQAPLWASLSPAERKKIGQLHLFRIGSSENLMGVLMTTALAPAGVDAARQVALVRRLLSGIAINLCDKLQLESNADQIRSTTDMLSLRSVADRN